jgi:DNA polymerase-3 subunit gamma/tau
VATTVPHQALYRRWRAQTFGEIVGQEAVVETLRNAVRTDRVSHAILFVGPRGTGKTSMARILAKAVNCTNLQDGDPCDTCEACVAVREGTTLDVLEIDAASNRGINEVRDLRDRLAYPPGHLRRKVYILDEAHQITRDAWNALLKSLEEPPDFVIFIFASTEPSGFPPAILSRLQRYDVRRLTIPEIEGKLTRILEADGRAIEPAALTLIARLAAGGMRDAESILDQLLSTTTETVTEAAVRDLLGLADAAAVDGFVDALAGGDIAAGVDILDQLEERGRDPRALLDQVVDTIRIRLVDPATTDHAGLVTVARRLVAIDPDRAGIGGLRLQLELALFAGGSTAPATAPTVVAAPEGAAAPAPVPLAESAAAAEAAPTTRAAPAPTTEATTVSDGSAPTTASTDELPTPKPATTLKAAEKPRAARVDRPETPATVGAAGTDATPSDAAPKDATPQDAAPNEATPNDAPTPAVVPTAGHADRPSVAVPIAVGDDLDRLLEGWPEIVKAVSPATRAVLTECRPIGVEGNVVTLGFPEAKGFLKDHAERRRQDVETAVGGLLGRPISVRTVATNIEVAPLGAADDLVAEARRIFGEDLVDVAEID